MEDEQHLAQKQRLSCSLRSMSQIAVLRSIDLRDRTYLNNEFVKAQSATFFFVSSTHTHAVEVCVPNGTAALLFHHFSTLSVSCKTYLFEYVLQTSSPKKKGDSVGAGSGSCLLRSSTPLVEAMCSATQRQQEDTKKATMI